jgi:hypothetical protein
LRRRRQDMYKFKAHYKIYDVKIVKKIDLDEKEFETEEEIFLCAMKTAYELIGEKENFKYLEFKGR